MSLHWETLVSPYALGFETQIYFISCLSMHLTLNWPLGAILNFSSSYVHWCKGISRAVTQIASPFEKLPTFCRHQNILTNYHSNFLIWSSIV